MHIADWFHHQQGCARGLHGPEQSARKPITTSKLLPSWLWSLKETMTTITSILQAFSHPWICQQFWNTTPVLISSHGRSRNRTSSPYVGFPTSVSFCIQADRLSQPWPHDRHAVLFIRFRHWKLFCKLDLHTMVIYPILDYARMTNWGPTPELRT